MAWNSVTTEEFKNGNNSATEFSFAFPYLQEEDVKVEIGLDGAWTANTAFTFKNATTIKFNSAPATGTANIRIYRDTEVDAAKAVYTAGATVRAKDLTDNSDQYLYALQEDQSNLVTSNDIRDGAIMNADINAKAEIEVSKLKDGTARQLLQTADDGTTVEWTSNVKVPGSFQSVGTGQFDSTVTIAGAVTVNSTVDGRDLAADGTKLDGIEAGATADQSNAEIRSAVEAATDSNVFTDADHSKLNAIEASATADQTNAEIRAAVEAASDSNVFTDADHTKLNAIAAGAEVNVQSDWNSSSGDSQILNKPTLVSGVNDLSDVDTTGVANDKILKYVAADSKWKVADDGGSGGGSALTVLNDSTTLSTGATKLTFTGAGVTATEPSDDEITVTVPGTDTNTTYTTSFVDSSNDCILRLTDSGSGTDDLKFVAGSNITLTPSGDNLTIASSGGGGTTSTDFKYLTLRNSDNSGVGVFNGSQATFTLVTSGTTTALTPSAANALIVSVAGVIQQPNTGNSAPTSGFAINGNQIIFGANLSVEPDFTLYLQGAGVASIADNTVTGAKIALGSDAAGDIMYYNGTDYIRLAKGTNGHYLKQGTSNAPEWAAVAVPDSDKIEKFDSKLEVTDTDGNAVGKISAYIDNTKLLEIDGSVDIAESIPLRLGAIGTQTNTLELVGSNGSTHTFRGNQKDIEFDAKGVNNNANTVHSWVKLKHASGSGETDTKVELYASNVKRLETSTTGVTVTGTVAATAYTGDGSALTGIESTSLDGCGYQNDQTISAGTYTIAANKGMHSVGPITNNGTVTVNGNWVIS